MSDFSQSKNVFLATVFSSDSPENSLQTIEVVGVPGEKLSNGEYSVNDKVKNLLDDLVIKRIFYKSRSIRECDFQFLKIWLYETDISNSKRGYEIPKIDDQDLSIYRSQNSSSKLKLIHVLDNGLEGEEKKKWEKVCQELFGSLFDKFIVPLEPPSMIKDNPLVNLFANIIESVDPYAKDKQDLYFDALIIQID